jgi:hypothetical protein
MKIKSVSSMAERDLNPYGKGVHILIKVYHSRVINGY